MEAFVNRYDMYATQYVSRRGNGYRAVRETLTAELVAGHLAGKHTLGLYALGSDSKAKWVVIDVDTTVVGRLEEVIEKSHEIGLPDPLIEYSGRKGYHAWFFFEKAVTGEAARGLGLAVTTKHEVFPKQKTVSRDASQPGSLVKAPLGIHRVSGNWSVFVDANFEKIRDPWAVLESIEKVDIGRFEALIRRGAPSRRMGQRSRIEFGRLRPCIERALQEGTREGRRNEVGHLIACLLRRLGRPRPEAAGVLACWNLRNTPRLSQQELRVILQSAYSGELYAYGCAPDGRLRRILECVGESRCRRFQQAGERPHTEETSERAVSGSFQEQRRGRCDVWS
jgi:hypothetical protein